MSLRIAILEKDIQERQEKESMETKMMEQCLKTAEERMKQQEMKLHEVCFDSFNI